jgi:hypothetical protein
MKGLKIGHELKIIKQNYLHKWSAEKAQVLCGSQRQYDLPLWALDKKV